MEIEDLSNDINAKPEVKPVDPPEAEGGMLLSDKYSVKINPDLIEGSEEDEETETGKEKTKEEESDNWNPAEIADLLVDTMDFIQEKGGEFFHYKTILTPQHRADLRDLIIAHGIKVKNPVAGKKELTFYERSLLERQAAHDEYVKLLPFSPDEAKRLKSAWRRFLKNKNAKISDGWALVITTATVFAPRLLPILANMFDTEKKNLNPETTAQQIQENEALNEMVKVMDKLNINEMSTEELKITLDQLKQKADKVKQKEQVSL